MSTEYTVYTSLRLRLTTAVLPPEYVDRVHGVHVIETQHPPRVVFDLSDGAADAAVHQVVVVVVRPLGPVLAERRRLRRDPVDSPPCRRRH